jgi:hypothetical protein
VGLAALERARPGEVELLDAGLPQPAQLGLGQLGAHVARVLLHEAKRERPLLARHLGERQTGERGELVAAARAAHDVAERLAADEHARALPRVRAIGQGSREILLPREGAQPLEGAAPHLGGIRAEEGGRHGDRLAGHEGEVQ